MAKLIIILLFLTSCSSSRTIKGVVTSVNGDVVSVGKYQFRVYDQIPKVGDTVSFTSTVIRKKINSKRL